MGSVSEVSYLTSLIAGGVAGIAVDTTLFPLDTTRTRLQSPQGFLKAGGFRGLYNGIGPAFLGSAPTGGIAAGLTTPIDVMKTRIMLTQRSTYQQKLHNVLMDIYMTKGIKGLFAGIIPRVLWITLGGGVFFGSYELFVDLCNTAFKKT